MAGLGARAVPASTELRGVPHHLGVNMAVLSIGTAHCYQSVAEDGLVAVDRWADGDPRRLQKCTRCRRISIVGSKGADWASRGAVSYLLRRGRPQLNAGTGTGGPVSGDHDGDPAVAFFWRWSFSDWETRVVDHACRPDVQSGKKL
ncbi:hypothetical protein LIA77_07238 [Sarocladium implicatum]|nr:hypothetical protein LIA77_07238 [Sarocladium implicatum]